MARIGASTLVLETSQVKLKTFARRHALIFGKQKINLHLSGKEFEPKAAQVQPGSGDLCFITDHPIDEVLASWKGAGLEVRGRVSLTGLADPTPDPRGRQCG